MGNLIESSVTVVVNGTGPSIASATYDAGTGVLAVTGSGMTAGNTIDVSKLTLTGEGGSPYTLTSGNVTASSAANFLVTMNAVDKAAVNLILNKNGTNSTSGTAYNIAAAEDWNASVDSGLTIGDMTGNAVTVSNVAVPMITGATYDASTGALVVTGTGFLKLYGATNDIVSNKFTLMGDGGATRTLTNTPNVEITRGTSFTITLSATDKAAVNQILNKNGTSSTDVTTYNLAAAADWAAGADSAVGVADLTGNGITVSKVASNVTITSTTPNPTNSAPFSVTITFTESVSDFGLGDITVTNGSASNLSGNGTTYTADIAPAAQGMVSVDVAAGVAHDLAGVGNTAATQLSRTYDSISPATPAISTSPQTINADSIIISGTAEAGATITITGGAAAATGTADGSGNYSITVTLTQNAVNTLVVKATDAAGNHSATARVAMTEDSTVPTASSIWYNNT